MGMKPRRVFVTLEIETKAKLSDYRSARAWSSALYGCPQIMWGDVLQAQANVARPHPSFDPKKLTKEGKKWLAKFKKARRKA